MKILITGAAGFIASHIADAYIEAGHEVVIVDNLSTGRKENLNPKAVFHQMDIRDKNVSAIFEQHRFDVVNHHAAQMDVRRSVEDPIYDAEVNALGFLNLLQNCAHTGVQKVIFASSGGAIYGEQDMFPADESHKTQPYSPYGITKLIGEKYLFFYHLTYGLQYVALRYANVYGPRQNPHGEAGVVAIFCERMLAGRQPVIYGSGEQTRDFVFVKDVVAANVAALSVSGCDTFNIGTAVETSVNQLFQKLNELTGARMPEKHEAKKEGEQMRSVINPGKAGRELGWKPRWSIDKGLAETVAYFRQRR
ncbi:MAG: UDP-glucose 4-epimerase [bacterium ADurb.Bin478]|nr:MAG: UDP-glucose 4-epimerase [bacterium ADurb.Bin478]